MSNGILCLAVVALTWTAWPLVAAAAPVAPGGQGDVNSVKDGDGNRYAVVVIGDQLWLGENLRTTKYSDGSAIPKITDNKIWGTTESGAYSWYNNDESLKAPYGPLYNWAAVADPRNMCPSGWRVPSDSDFLVLVTHLGGADVAGGKMKETGTTHWTRNLHATNESGFRAIPSGDRHDEDGLFYDLDYLSYIWTSTESSAKRAWTYELNKGNATARRTSPPKKDGFSVRCMKDRPKDETTARDVDGNEYKVVRIGSQTWMAENLRTTKYRNGSAISHFPEAKAWLAATGGAYSWYNNDATANKTIYGALYNWYAVKDQRQICPVAWHVPTDAEWTSMENFLGGGAVAGGRLKDTGTNRWLRNPTVTGFAALPGGLRFVGRPIHNPAGAFDVMGYTGLWWTANELGTTNAAFAYIDGGAAGLFRGQENKRSGFSVRCLKD